MPVRLQPYRVNAAFFRDNEGHCIMLYYYMEQVGWDGKPCPRSQRRITNGEWPEVVEALADTYWQLNGGCFVYG